MSSSDDFISKFAQLSGETTITKVEEKFGRVETVETSFLDKKEHILVIDDNWDIITDLLSSVNALKINSELPGDITIFRVAKHEGATLEDCLRWIKNHPRFDAIYIDADLEDLGSGANLASSIRKIAGLEFQEIGIVTAGSTDFDKKFNATFEKEGLRLFGKFDQQTGVATVRALFRNIKDLQATSRSLFWATCERRLIHDLEEGKSVKKSAELFGKMLEEHYGVYAWYLREMKEDTLDAIAMKDPVEFTATTNLPKTEAAKFQLDLLNLDPAEKSVPWIKIDEMTIDDCGSRKEMIGHRVIAARVGASLGGGIRALFTAYRKPADIPFTSSDAQNLHHIAILLRLGLTPERNNDRLTELTETLGNVYDSSSTSEIARGICAFIHEHINRRFGYRSERAKVGIRLFWRGSGKLVRWGNTGETALGTEGSMPKKGEDYNILIRNKHSTYVRAIVEQRTIESGDGEALTHSRTEPWVRSYLTVPLKYDGAVIGAINLEAEAEQAYSENDRLLVETVAQVAAAAILTYRSNRFMRELADLTADTVNLNKSITPDEILTKGARILYRLCGFSDLLLFEPEEDHNAPWQIAKSWQGDGKCSSERQVKTLQGYQNQINQKWHKTYLRACLTDRSGSKTFIKQDEAFGFRDTGEHGLRPLGRDTRSQMVVLLGEQGQPPLRALTLLFEHPFPIPEHYHQVFASFAHFLDTVYTAVQKEYKRYGEEMNIARLEARQGLVYSQVRHSIASHLSSAASAITSGIYNERDKDEILDEALKRIQEAEAEFERNKILLKTPKPEKCDIGEIWSGLLKELAQRAESENIELQPISTSILAKTDPQLFRSILFNLADNALLHGAANGATKIWLEPDAGSVAVCDNGRPIDEELSRNIFDIGQTTRGKGSGQGLHLARTVARDLFGDLIYIRKKKANCFVITLNPLEDT